MSRPPQAWADVIGEASDTMKNAVISIIDPSQVSSTYNADTDTYTSTGDAVVAEFITARIQPFRASSDLQGRASGNPSGEQRLRVQIPRTAYAGRIERGFQIRVTECERFPELLTYVLVVDANVNSSWRASNTVECTINVESEAV